MRDELFELVIKKASGRATEEDFNRIDAILELEPQLWDDYNQWHRDMPALKGAICFASATAEDRHEMPEHIRKELRARMRASLRKPQPNYDRLMEELINKPPNPQPTWRWAAVPAVGLAAIVVISLVLFNNQPQKNQPQTENPHPSNLPNALVTPVAPVAQTEPVIQVALLDIVGTTRGPGDATLKQFTDAWPGINVHQFNRTSQSKDWLSQWPLTISGPICKIFYDQSAGELRIITIINEQKNEASFMLNDIVELPNLIQKAKAQLDKWLK